MFKNISLSLSGLVFVIVIAIVYFKKKKYSNVDNNIYRIMILWTIGLLFLETSCDIIISYRESLPLLTEFLCRLYIFGSATWFVLLIAYMKAFLNPEKYKNVMDVFSEKSMSILICIGSVFYFISCFLGLTYTSVPNGEFNVIGGDAVFVLYAVFAVVSVLMVRVLSKNLNRVTLIKRLPILLYLVLFSIMKIFQYFYTDVSDLGFLFAFCIVAMYFTIENQDIKLVSELEIARKNAEEADKSKTEFLSKMSHEIRTPMNVIMGYSEYLTNKDNLSENETLEDTKSIYSAGKSLLELINNILLFSKIESDRENVDNIEYSISDIMLELHSFINSRIENKNLKFEINVDKSVPLKYMGDKQKIYRILVNLLDNCVNNSSDGIIRLNVCCDIEKENFGYLRFEIQDNSKVIKKKFLNTIKKYFSLLDEKKLTINDTELGLLLANKLCKMLDAKVYFDNKQNVGFKLTVVIFQQIVGQEMISNFNFSNDFLLEKEEYLLDCSKYKVLIVDDNNMNLKVIEKLLKTYKIKTELLKSGTECVNNIKQGKKYDLILLDHMMPEMDGINTLKMLKQINSKSLPPIVVMTANNVSELKTMYEEAGFDDYISKPINTKDLNKLMYKYFKNK